VAERGRGSRATAVGGALGGGVLALFDAEITFEAVP
jgi:hypothetical protein